MELVIKILLDALWWLRERWYRCNGGMAGWKYGYVKEGKDRRVFQSFLTIAFLFSFRSALQWFLLCINGVWREFHVVPSLTSYLTEGTKSGSLPPRSLSLPGFASLMSKGVCQFHINMGSEPGAWEHEEKWSCSHGRKESPQGCLWCIQSCSPGPTGLLGPSVCEGYGCPFPLPSEGCRDRDLSTRS